MRNRMLFLMLISLAAPACKRIYDRIEAPPPVNQSASITEQSSRSCVNINAATAEELMRLPGIGEVLSQKIIEHRKLHGLFRRPQDLIIIEGFSERKYRAIAALVCVE